MPHSPQKHHSFWHRVVRRHPERLVVVLVTVLAIALTAIVMLFLTKGNLRFR